MQLTYLIRYGLMGHIGQFPAPAGPASVFQRGQIVVIRSNRGEELGEVLTAYEDSGLPNSVGEFANRDGNDFLENSAALLPSVSRAALAADLTRAQQANELRPDRLAMCVRILDEAGWPWELIDVEPLLDGETIVLHYLGPHEVDAASLRARFRVACKTNIVLEPVGIDVPLDHSSARGGCHGCGSGCGSCGQTSEGCGGCAGHSASPSIAQLSYGTN